MNLQQLTMSGGIDDAGSSRDSLPANIPKSFRMPDSIMSKRGSWPLSISTVHIVLPICSVFTDENLKNARYMMKKYSSIARALS